MEIQNCIAVEQFTEEIKGNQRFLKFSGNRRNLVEKEENINSLFNLYKL